MSWKSSKEEITIDFTTKVEYIFTFKAVKYGIWIKKIKTELRVVPSIIDPI